MPRSAGYIYVLINRSMPGLVKIGRTVRPPGQRAAQLSSATGVPTPFELVFDIVVPDYVQAERILHHFLAERGFRLSTDREFFEAPIRDVITLMLQVRELVERTAIDAGPDLDDLLVTPEGAEDITDADPLLRDAAEAAIAAGQGSTSVIQRSLRIGYGRAAQIIEQLEQRGIVGPPHGASPRQVLVTRSELDSILSAHR